ncbi:MAG: signal peptidase I [Candidatus Glassbacteria bacterium]|nr:signal peptidase I [Candidatus Glassbacteria bacterium]
MNNNLSENINKTAVLLEWVKSIALAFALVFLLLRPFVVQAYHVPTGSMETTLRIGDYLLVNKLVFGGTSPRDLPFTELELPGFHMPGLYHPDRGDIVVFEDPFDRSEDYVKRCVAVPGDTVEMRDKVLYINQVPQTEPYVRHEDPQLRRNGNRSYGVGTFAWQSDYLARDGSGGPGGGYLPTRDNFGPLVVPGGKYFCLGDNRDVSFDSRFWGFVDREAIKGKPMIITFSWDKDRRLPRLERVGRVIQ